MKILNDLNIKPRNIELYEQAFSHASYINENNLEGDYERLEFLGDSVLDLVVSEYLFLNTEMFEGEMTKHRANYVCTHALYEYAKELEFEKYIKVGKGELSSGGNMRESTMADCFESFIGAIYIDLGYETAKKFIDSYVIPHIKKTQALYFEDYKSQLQERLNGDEASVIYKLIKTKGPSHDPLFTVSVTVIGMTLGTGTAGSKKAAEQLAAKEALENNANWK